MAREFNQYVANMGIIVKNVAVEVHHFIGIVERYHGLLRRVDSIIIIQIPGIKPELALQMSFKAINDSVSPNKLVPTLLVFGAYPRMTKQDAPSLSITQGAMTMQKAMDEIRRSTASRQVNDSLNIRDGLSTGSVYDLPINSPVLVYREGNTGQSGEWKRPYNLLSIQGKSMIIGLPHGPTKFRSISIKPYFIDSTSIDDHQLVPNSFALTQAPRTEAPLAEVSPTEASPAEVLSTEAPPAEVPPTDAPQAKAPSAPLASLTSVKHGQGRPGKHPEQANIAFSDICFVIDEFDVFTNKDANTQPPQYTASRQKKFAGLLEKVVFKVVTTEDIPSNVQIFNFRFVDEIKNPGTDKTYEKSRPVLYSYNDKDKNLLLT